MRVLRARLYQKALDERRAEEEKRVGEKKAIEWGSQIRSYVLHPYRMVKDHRTGFEIGRHGPGARRRPDALRRGVPQVGRRRKSAPRAVLTRTPAPPRCRWMDEVAERLEARAQEHPEPPGRAAPGRRARAALRARRGAVDRPDAPHRDRRAPPRADLVSGRRRGGGGRVRVRDRRSARPRRSSASPAADVRLLGALTPADDRDGLLRRAVRRRDPVARTSCGRPRPRSPR